jgi:hypothetical protein
MNKRLWKDASIFESFHKTVLMLNKTVADQDWNPNTFLTYADELDNIMQKYEESYDQIEDPIFYWSFATANALFLLIGKKYDELGSTRIAYIVNGYQSGLEFHTKYPSYPKIYIDKAFEHMAPFADGEDATWLKKNRYTYTPIPG